MDPLTPLNTQQDPNSILQQLMLQIQARQNQPIIPDNPFAQAGTILSGFGAGVQGRPNPVMAQFAQQRKDDLAGMQAQAGIAGTMATLQDRQQTRAEARQDKIDSTLLGLLKNDSPDARLYAGQALQQRMRKLGVDIPDNVVVGLGSGKLKIEDYKEVGILAGMGISDDVISRRTGVSLDLIPGIKSALQNDDSRKLLGLSTKVEEASKSAETQNKWLEGLQKRRELSIPLGLEKNVVTFGLKMFKKGPDELTSAELSAAADAAIKHDLDKARLSASVQGMPGETARVLATGEAAVAAITTVNTILNDPAKFGVVKDYIGPMMTGAPVREGLVRNLPSGLVGEVPPDLSDLGYAEDQYKNLLVAARSGQAVTEGEFARNMAEAPNRSKDKPEVYRRKMQHAFHVSQVLSKRMSQLTGVGGRAAAHPVDTVKSIPLPSLTIPADTRKLFFNPKTSQYGRGEKAPGTDWVEVKQ